jgi:hypothetical protein
MDDDAMYDEPGGTTQKLPSGRYPTPKFVTEFPISNFVSMILNSFSSFILENKKEVIAVRNFHK